MTIHSPDHDHVESLREVAKVSPKLYPDGGFWFEINHPHPHLVVRVGFKEDEAIVDLYNQQESLTQESVSLSGDVQAELQSAIESIYSRWRNVVL